MKKKPRASVVGSARIAKPEVAPYGRGLGTTTPIETCSPTIKGRSVQLCMKRTERAGRRVASHIDVCAILRPLAARDRESFIALHLDTRGRHIGTEEISRGSLGGVETHPREVFKGAIVNNTAALIVAHNHPSGVAVPSPEDRVFTAHIAKALRAVGLQLLDSLVVTETGHHSMQEHGTLPTE